jgi:hypothetical protein
MTLASSKINHSEGQPGWLELYDLSLHSDVEARSPMGAYIQGKISEEQHFFPTSEVRGKAIPKPEDIGQNSGWVELETRRFHSDIEAVAPRHPYITGTKDQDGNFYPHEPYEIIFD